MRFLALFSSSLFLPLIFCSSAGLVPLFSLLFFFLFPTSKPRPLASGYRCCCWKYSEQENAHGFSAYTDHNTTHTQRTTHFRLNFHARPHSHPDVRWPNRFANPRARSGTVFRTKIVPFLRNNTRDKHSRFDHGSAKVGHFEKFSSLALCFAAAATLLLRTHIGRIVTSSYCCFFSAVASTVRFINQRAADERFRVFTYKHQRDRF